MCRRGLGWPERSQKCNKQTNLQTETCQTDDDFVSPDIVTVAVVSPPPWRDLMVDHFCNARRTVVIWPGRECETVPRSTEVMVTKSVPTDIPASISGLVRNLMVWRRLATWRTPWKLWWNREWALWFPREMTSVLSFSENLSKLKPTDIISDSTEPSIKIYSKRFAHRNR